jgi:hypothetical protein
MPIIATRASAAYGAGFGKGASEAAYAGPFGAYDSLAAITVPSGGVVSIYFDGIPAGYKHLQIRTTVKTTRTDSRNDDLMIRYNGDRSSSNYYNHQLYGTGASAGSQAFAATGNSVAYIPGTLNNTNMMGVAIIDILDYASTTKCKTTRAIAGYNGVGSVGYAVLNSGGWFATPVAITSIDIAPNSLTSFAQYSTFELYGVK